MNNDHFRKLLATPARPSDGSPPSSRAGATPAAFGGKRSSLVPMTPRTVKGGIDVDFARQVRERNAALQPKKQFKSHAPKGAKFAAGYVDRAKAREEAEAEDDRAARIKALEEQMKLQQISQQTFEALRDQITGGDISSTHLVKGLDRKLLERVKRGEDVLGTGGSGDTEKKGEAPAPDVDEELDKLAEREVETLQKVKAEKKGTMAPPSLAGKKRSRDEIMAELKAQRQAAAQARAAPLLDARWRKVGEKEKSRVEIDHKGREVLITVDEDGVVKKKVRKLPAKDAAEQAVEAVRDMPDASKPALGSDVVVPELPQAAPAADEDDEDIFEGAGTEYNPLGDEADDDDDDDSDDDDDATPAQGLPKSAAQPPERKASTNNDEDDENDLEGPHDEASPEEPREITETDAKPTRRNYFNDTAASRTEAEGDRFAGIQNVLKKAAQMDAPKDDDDDAREGETEEARQKRLKRRARMLAAQDRDLEDMDMGFGGSRLEDEAEADEEGGKKIRLSEWKGGAGEGWGEDGNGGKGGKGERKKRERKPKKRKGDVNSAADIMRVIEGRKTGGK